MSKCSNCENIQCTSAYILEMQRLRHGGGFDHFGYINICFASKEKAAEYYKMKNPHMRGLNATNDWCSYWDPVTKLRTVIRKRCGETITLDTHEQIYKSVASHNEDIKLIEGALQARDNIQRRVTV